MKIRLRNINKNINKNKIGNLKFNGKRGISNTIGKKSTVHASYLRFTSGKFINNRSKFRRNDYKLNKISNFSTFSKIIKGNVSSRSNNNNGGELAGFTNFVKMFKFNKSELSKFSKFYNKNIGNVGILNKNYGGLKTNKYILQHARTIMDKFTFPENNGKDPKDEKKNSSNNINNNEGMNNGNFNRGMDNGNFNKDKIVQNVKNDVNNNRNFNEDTNFNNGKDLNQQQFGNNHNFDQQNKDINNGKDINSNQQFNNFNGKDLNQQFDQSYSNKWSNPMKNQQNSWNQNGNQMNNWNQNANQNQNTNWNQNASQNQNTNWNQNNFGNPQNNNFQNSQNSDFQNSQTNDFQNPQNQNWNQNNQQQQNWNQNWNQNQNNNWQNQQNQNYNANQQFPYQNPIFPQSPNGSSQNDPNKNKKSSLQAGQSFVLFLILYLIIHYLLTRWRKAEEEQSEAESVKPFYESMFTKQLRQHDLIELIRKRDPTAKLLIDNPKFTGDDLKIFYREAIESQNRDVLELLDKKHIEMSPSEIWRLVEYSIINERNTTLQSVLNKFHHAPSVVGDSQALDIAVRVQNYPACKVLIDKSLVSTRDVSQEQFRKLVASSERKSKVDRIPKRQIKLMDLLLINSTPDIKEKFIKIALEVCSTNVKIPNNVIIGVLTHVDESTDLKQKLSNGKNVLENILSSGIAAKENGEAFWDDQMIDWLEILNQYDSEIPVDENIMKQLKAKEPEVYKLLKRKKRRPVKVAPTKVVNEQVIALTPTPTIP